jgi:hypothetical protein
VFENIFWSRFSSLVAAKDIDLTSSADLLAFLHIASANVTNDGKVLVALLSNYTLSKDVSSTFVSDAITHEPQGKPVEGQSKASGGGVFGLFVPSASFAYFKESTKHWFHNNHWVTHSKSTPAHVINPSIGNTIKNNNNNSNNSSPYKSKPPVPVSNATPPPVSCWCCQT